MINLLNGSAISTIDIYSLKIITFCSNSFSLSVRGDDRQSGRADSRHFSLARLFDRLHGSRAWHRLQFVPSKFTASTKWPSGTYGIPRAQSGCPSSSGFKWRTGWRFQDTQDIFPSNAHSGNFHLDASVDKNNLKRSFCMKTDTTDDSTRPQWPKGKVAANIFRVCSRINLCNDLFSQPVLIDITRHWKERAWKENH